GFLVLEMKSVAQRDTLPHDDQCAMCIHDLGECLFREISAGWSFPGNNDVNDEQQSLATPGVSDFRGLGQRLIQSKLLQRSVSAKRAKALAGNCSKTEQLPPYRN